MCSQNTNIVAQSLISHCYSFCATTSVINWKEGTGPLYIFALLCNKPTWTLHVMVRGIITTPSIQSRTLGVKVSSLSKTRTVLFMWLSFWSTLPRSISAPFPFFTLANLQFLFRRLVDTPIHNNYQWTLRTWLAMHIIRSCYWSLNPDVGWSFLTFFLTYCI